jgi:glycosyltransferase involved in cell wall biosynthesis
MAGVAIVMAQGEISGAETVLLELLQEIRPFPATILAPASSPLAKRVDALGYRVVDFSVPKLSQARSARRYVGALARSYARLFLFAIQERPSVLHAFLPLTLKVVAPIAFGTRRPLVATMHDVVSTAEIGRFRSACHKRLARMSRARILAVSDYIARSLLESGYPPTAVTVVHNGVSRSASARNTGPVVRACLGVPSDALLFAVVGRLTHWKGQDVAIRALARMARATEAAPHLVIIGGPFEEADRAYAASLRLTAAELGVGDRVHFVGRKDDTRPYYEAANVILVPSTRPDPFPTVVLEAGLAARPAIVTNLGGACEAVIDGVSGYVVAPTAPAFAAAMEKAADSGWRARAGVSANAAIGSKFSRAAYAARVKQEWSRCAPSH